MAFVTNREIEDAAIAHVLRLEETAGRTARDTRKSSALTDIEGDWLIEVKAYGRPLAVRICGWNRNKYRRPKPTRAVLFDGRGKRPTGNPEGFRVHDITGEVLLAMLQKKREKRYFEVPIPVAIFDRLRSPSP